MSIESSQIILSDLSRIYIGARFFINPRKRRNMMEIKWKKDWRKKPPWEKVDKIDFRTYSDAAKILVQTSYHGWILLEDCQVRNANFNTKRGETWKPE